MDDESGFSSLACHFPLRGHGLIWPEAALPSAADLTCQEGWAEVDLPRRGDIDHAPDRHRRGGDRGLVTGAHRGAEEVGGVGGGGTAQTTVHTARITTIVAAGAEAGVGVEAATAATVVGAMEHLRATLLMRSFAPRLLTTGTTGG